MPAANIIQLRRLLSEKFPGLRTGFGDAPRVVANVWPTGLAQIDEAARGGLPKGAFTEIIAEKPGAGGALLARAVRRQAFRQNQLLAHIDGHDSLDVTQGDEDFSRLLWVRCRSAAEALKAADLLLRDGNLSLVLIDLMANPAAQLRKIPATTWYRFQRLIEQTSIIGIVLTPRAMISPAQVRIRLESRFSLAAMECNESELLCELKMEVTEMHRLGEISAPLQNTA
jgi:hypothetical protein